MKYVIRVLNLFITLFLNYDDDDGDCGGKENVWINFHNFPSLIIE